MNEESKNFFEKLAGVSRIDGEEGDFEPKFAKAEKSDVKIEVESSDNNKDKNSEPDDIFIDEGEGQLVLDVYQTTNDIIIEAPIAGVSADDLDVEISPESVIIKGKREKRERIEKRDYLFQELYWGRFSRSVILPQEINPDHAKAEFKSGVLKLVLPKLNRQKTKKMKIKFD